MSDKVLFVDDDRILLRALCRSLDERYEIETAASGAEAIEILKIDSSIACVVSDMKMPEMDGIELVRQIKESQPHLPCIILTGNQDDETEVRAREIAKVYRLMNKPSPRAELIETIDNAVRESRSHMAAQLNEPQTFAPEQLLARS